MSYVARHQDMTSPAQTSLPSTLRFSATLWLVAIAFAACSAHAADAPADKTAPARSSTPALKQIGPARFTLNGVTLDNNLKTVSFPARVNMNSNLVEYVVVQDEGKTHESLLATAIAPRDIHMAMLFIGAKGGPQGNPWANGDAPSPRGDEAQIRLEWTSDGKKHTARPEDLILNDTTRKHMNPSAWTYNGSWTFNGVFQADLERSIIAIFTDPNALVNTLHKDRSNDDIWFVDPIKTPIKDTPVTVTLSLPKRQSARKPTK